MNRAIIVTEKATGLRYIGEVKTAWYHPSYSFDGGDNWNRSRVAAFRDAQQRGRLFESKGVQPRVSLYRLTNAFSRPIRLATRVTFSDGQVINFMERLSASAAVKQATALREKE